MSLFGKKKKKTYTRPEGWERTIKGSAYDSDKDYTGKSYDSYKKEKEKDQYEKRKGSFFEKIKKSLSK